MINDYIYAYISFQLQYFSQPSYQKSKIINNIFIFILTYGKRESLMKKII
ncbi:unnamed protein product [Paramecium octaurelia]|uniref:Uncharacterized protein n=1 Tax=Paramecium octaurelia TaxID=43137 RepID=A0A8S1X9Z5_PAROT|nr:unnamed protein product [Paramecium octaurelia]